MTNFEFTYDKYFIEVSAVWTATMHFLCEALQGQHIQGIKAGSFANDVQKNFETMLIVLFKHTVTCSLFGTFERVKKSVYV